VLPANGEVTRQKGLLGGVLHPVQLHGVVWARPMHGDEYQVLDAGIDRRGNEGAVAVAVDGHGVHSSRPDETMNGGDHRRAIGHRSCYGSWRTYVIDWSASWDGGAFSCSSKDSGQAPFTVTVPHDQGNN